MASAAGLAGSAVSAYSSLKAGAAQGDVARANAITAGAQADYTARVGASNANLIADQGAFNVAETLRRTDFNAAQIDRATGDARTSLALREGQMRLAGEMALGEMRARVGASGVTMDGSPLEVLAFQAGQNELAALTERMAGNAQIADLQAQAEATRRAGAADALAMAYDTAGRAFSTRSGAASQAAGTRSQVGIYNAQGRAAQSAGMLGAASAIFSGAGRFGDSAVSTVKGWLP